ENLSEWDKLGPEISGSEEVVFFFEPGTDENGICKTRLINSAGDRALVLSFSRNSLPYFALWKSRLNNDDGYVCGLEPTINFPNVRSVEKQHGRVAKLNPKESRTFELNFEILNDKNTIQKTETEIRNFKTKAKIEPKPIKEWT
ncbi:MAG: aldose 1-epimerase family protein, partial [Planctomycetaceae bacterium]|nr:aldose 1-epimerase family protein [Planctomycetaceae bacterium]